MSFTLHQMELEHDRIVKEEKEIECYTPPYGDERTNYIEKFYVANYSPVTENLRFYQRKSGRYKGKFYTVYRDRVTGKTVPSPLKAYLKQVDEALENTIAPIRKIDIEILQHIRKHIAQKIMKNHREVLRDLRRAREKRLESIED